MACTGLPTKRKQQILDHIAANPTESLASLSRRFRHAESTIRKIALAAGHSFSDQRADDPTPEEIAVGCAEARAKRRERQRRERYELPMYSVRIERKAVVFHQCG
jgi:hypothetical protein